MTRIELVERLERTYQRLQLFQERYAAQLSHTDRQWLHQILHEVARYHAELSPPWRTGSTAPERHGIAPRWQKAVQSTPKRLEAYLQAHFEVQFTHDFCPCCTQRLHGLTLPDAAGGDERHRGDHV